MFVGTCIAAWDHWAFRPRHVSAVDVSLVPRLPQALLEKEEEEGMSSDEELERIEVDAVAEADDSLNVRGSLGNCIPPSALSTR